MKLKKMTVDELLVAMKADTTEENKAQLKNLYEPIVNAVNGLLDEIVKGAADKEDLSKIDELKAALNEINGEKGMKGDIQSLFDQVKQVNETISTLKKQGMSQDVISKFDEQLNAMASGGTCWTHSALDDGCPKCKSKNIKAGNIGQTMKYKCKDCGYEWM